MIRITIIIIITIIITQDQSLPTRWYQHNILKKPEVDPKCRLCGFSRRPLTTWSLAAQNWLKLNTSTATTRQRHTCTWRSAKSLVLRWRKWYEHEPKTATENESVTILWVMPIYTDRTIAANWPDIVLKNKKDKTWLLIDMALPLDTNTSVKTTEKLTKYKDLEIEVEWMWGLKTRTVPVVMGAPGTIKKDMESYYELLLRRVPLHQVETLFASQSLWFGLGCW